MKNIYLQYLEIKLESRDNVDENIDICVRNLWGQSRIRYALGFPGDHTTD